MFVIIDMSENKNRIFEKWRKHEIELNRFDVASAAPFFVLKANKKYTDIARVKSLVECYGSAIFAKGYEIPTQLRELEFQPSVLPLKMLIKTVADYFLRQEAMGEVSVSVVDEFAKAGDMLQYLAKSVRYLRVITSRPDRYELYSNKLYSSLGISVELSGDLMSAYGSDVIISLDDTKLEDFNKSKIVVHKKLSSNRNVYCLDKSDLKYKFFDCTRYGIDEFYFLCALYETCGYRIKDIPNFINT